MGGKTVSQRKLLAALVAFEGFLARMGPFVLGQIGGGREGFVADVASDRFLVRVRLMVYIQSVGIGEGLIAHCTRIWPFTCVNLLVPQQVIIARE